MDKKQISYRLIDAIHRSGKTYAGLAREAGINPRTITNCTNYGTIPCSDTLALLCGALGVSADWVLGLSEIITPESYDKWEEGICAKALDKYGAEHQFTKMLEEMAELQNAMCKYKDGRDTLEHIAEEIADVEIMLVQMKRRYGIKALVHQKRREKAQRLEERMKADGTAKI